MPRSTNRNAYDEAADAQKVVSVDAAGVARGTSSTGATTSVNAAASDTAILAANSLRQGATVQNDSAAILYLLLGSGTASTSNFTVKMAAGDYFEVPFGYRGAIRGIWASATGAARVTELT